MAKETNLVAYGSYTEEAAEAEKEQIVSGNTTFRKLKANRNYLRVPPPPKGKDSPFEVVWNHFVNVPDANGEESLVVVRCPRMMKKGKTYCPICKRVEELGNSGNPLDRTMAGRIRAKQSAIINTIDRKDPDSGIMPLNCNSFIYKALNAIRKDPDDPCDFTHPIKGYDIYIDRTGSGKKDTRYTVKLGKQCPLDESVEKMNDIILGQPDTSKFATLSSDEDLLALARGERPDHDNSSSNRLPADTRSNRRSQRSDDDVIDAEVEDEDAPV